MATFFATNISADSNEFLLSEDESKHCIRVLRYRLGSIVDIVDGKGYQFIGKIVDDHPKRCKLQAY